MWDTRVQEGSQTAQQELASSLLAELLLVGYLNKINITLSWYDSILKYQISSFPGPVVRRPDSGIRRIVIFSHFFSLIACKVYTRAFTVFQSFLQRLKNQYPADSAIRPSYYKSTVKSYNRPQEDNRQRADWNSVLNMYMTRRLSAVQTLQHASTFSDTELLNQIRWLHGKST